MTERLVRFGLRLPLELRDELQRVATLERRASLNSLIVYALSEWLAGRGYRSR